MITFEEIQKFSVAPPFKEYLIRKKKQVESLKDGEHRYLKRKKMKISEEAQSQGHTSPTETDTSQHQAETSQHQAETPQPQAETSQPKANTSQSTEENVSKDREAPSTYVSRDVSKICLPPRFSNVTEKERAEYYEGLRRHLTFPILNLEQQLAFVDYEKKKTQSDTNHLQSMEWDRFYTYLHQKVKQEQQEFLVYASQAAGLNPAFSAYLQRADSKYISDYLEMEEKCRLAGLPEHFEEIEDPFPLNQSWDGPQSDLQWTQEKEVLKLGSLPNLVLPNMDRLPYPSLNTSPRILSRHFPVCSEAVVSETDQRLDWKLPVVSADPVARQIAARHSVDVVVSASSLVSLMNNTAPHFLAAWTMPVHVRTECGHRCVFVDKPVRTRRAVTEQDKNNLYLRRCVEMQYLNHSRSPGGGVWDDRPRVEEEKNKEKEKEEKAKEGKLEERKEERKDEIEIPKKEARRSVEMETSTDDEGCLTIDVPAPQFNEDDCPQSPEPEELTVEVEDFHEKNGLSSAPKTIPLERISESEEEATSPRLPSTNDLLPKLNVRRRCWVYAVWQFAGKRILVRYSLHGVVKPKQRRGTECKNVKIPAYLQLKVENQPYFGCEVLTFRELWKSWVACLLRGRSEIVRVRTNFCGGAVLHIEQETCLQMQNLYPGFLPKTGVILLAKFFQRFDNLSVGDYLLHHEKGRDVCQIMRAVQKLEMSEEQKKLLIHLPSFIRKQESPQYNAWLPIDLRLYNIHHYDKKTVPCLFPIPPRPDTRLSKTSVLRHDDKSGHRQPWKKGRGGKGKGGGERGKRGRGRGRGGRGGRGRGRGRGNVSEYVSLDAPPSEMV